MSLITQCPACATMFRVVPDQLRISEGWVRCGHCDEVFDANAHLRSLTEGQAPAAQQTLIADQTQESPDPVVVSRQQESRQAYDWGSVLPAPVQPGAAIQAGATAVTPATVNAASDVGAITATDVATDEAMQGVWSASGSPELESPFVEPSFDLPLDAFEQAVAQPAGAELDAFMQHNPHGSAPAAMEQDAPGLQQPLAATQLSMQAERVAATGFTSPAPEPDDLVEQVPPSFMTPAGGAASGQAAWVPKAWLAFAVLLALLLPLQYLLQNRDRLAGSAPVLQPLLVTACGWIGCTIAAPRQIESIAIESSAFTSVKPGVYVLSVGLKNAAPYALATPALELTLTDRKEQVLLRRVLLPSEWSTEAQMVGSAEASASVPVSTAAGVAVDRIAGYKLLVFYP